MDAGLFCKKKKKKKKKAVVLGILGRSSGRVNHSGLTVFADKWFREAQGYPNFCILILSCGTLIC